MKKAISLSVLAVLLLTLVLGFSNRQWLKDSYVVNFSDVQPEAAALASRISLTDDGTFLYKASQPEVLDSKAFNESCSQVQREQSIVLGCYTRQRFFIFDVDDPRLEGVKEVTAAHEMLHAVYERLPSRSRRQLDSQLIAAADNIADQRFKDTVTQYQKTEPDQIANELHSILGTEITSLPPELEKHYSQYFTDRQKIANFAKQYEDTFASLDDQIRQYDGQLIELKNQKTALEFRLQSLQQNIDSEQARMNQLRASNQIEAYNQAVPLFNEMVRSYNTNVNELKKIITEYNSIVETRNRLATTQSDLARELNSTYQTLD